MVVESSQLDVPFQRYDPKSVSDYQWAARTLLQVSDKARKCNKAQVYGSFGFDLLNQIIPNIFYVCINMKWDYSNIIEAYE